VDAYLVVYAATDRLSFTFAQLCLQDIRKRKGPRAVAVLVANKQDLVRNRVISTSGIDASVPVNVTLVLRHTLLVYIAPIEPVLVHIQVPYMDQCHMTRPEQWI